MPTPLIDPERRVVLRPWANDDGPFLVAAFADPEIRRYNGAHDRHGRPAPPPTVAEMDADIERFAQNWRAFEAGGPPDGVAFAITDARSGAPVGGCGVDYWNGEDVAQFGYWIAPDARRHGYATRAAVLFSRWLFECGAARVVLTVVAGNDASIAVARRAGFSYEGTMRSHSVWQGQRLDVLWFGALADERPHHGG